ncbi:MAG: hypothetical protein E7157_05920 [Lactobacillales bacterium]|nr:hypothetical protein [Lactobacillales bacterium]
MKKIAILLFTLLLFTGCTVVRIDTKSIDNIVSVILSKDNKLYNRVGKGYKYYVPRGVSYIDTNDLNDKLYSDGNYYYLYIDAVSYFYKTETEYNENKNAYYSRKIDGVKKGYLEINQIDNKYKIDFFYNYSKIEAIVNKEDIEKAVLDASYILSTVKFNDNIIELMLNDDYFTNKEEQYDKFESKTKIDKNTIEVEN